MRYSTNNKTNKTKFESFITKINPSEFYDKIITFVNNENDKILSTIKSKANYYLSKKHVATGIQPNTDFTSNSHVRLLKNQSIKTGDGVFALLKSSIEKFNFGSTLNNGQEFTNWFFYCILREIPW